MNNCIDFHAAKANIVRVPPNMPFGAFRSDKVAGDKWGVKTVNAVLLSAHETPAEAMKAARRVQSADKSGKYRYWVADSAYPVEETISGEENKA